MLNWLFGYKKEIKELHSKYDNLNNEILKLYFENLDNEKNSYQQRLRFMNRIKQFDSSFVITVNKNIFSTVYRICNDKWNYELMIPNSKR